MRAATRIEQRVDEIAERLIATYARRIPAYADARPETIDDALKGARDAVLASLGAVTGRLKVEHLFATLSEIGRKRALDGIALHDVLLANVVAIEVLWEELTSVAAWESENERARVQEVFMRSAIDLLQEAVSGIASGYIEIEQGRVADQEHEMQILLETIAGLRQEDPAHRERIEALGVDMDGLRWCAVIHPDEDETGRLIAALRRDHPGAIVGRTGRKVAAFLPDMVATELPGAAVGLARFADGPASFRRAGAALEVARHLGKSRVHYEEVVPLALLLSGPEEEREAFMQAQIGPLLDDPMGTDLLRSLREYYRHGQSVAAASRTLFVHRHTLEYRLARIEAALGVDIREPQTRLLLEFALQLWLD